MLLPWLIFLPIIGGILCWISQRFFVNAPRYIALLTMIAIFGLSVSLWIDGNFIFENTQKSSAWVYEFRADWIPQFGITFHLGLDGLSILMVVLSAFLGLFSVLTAWREVHRGLGLFHLNILWMCAGVIGVFLAVDLFLFFFFWEMMLLPMYFLIAIWGYKELNNKNNHARFSAATKFLIYTQASGLLMLLSILALAIDYNLTTEHWSFDYVDLKNTSLLNYGDSALAEYIIMFGFFIAFIVKMPLFPFHGWLIDAHAQSTPAGSIDINGLLIKTAAYGFMRFCIPIFPNASYAIAPIAIGLGIISIFYGAILAYAQNDMKKLIAYTSVSHMGLVMIALFTPSILAYQGAMIMMIAHALSASGLFIVCGQLYSRLNTRDIREMGGLWGKIKFLPACTLFFAIATLGLPGTGNFIGEFLMFFGVFHYSPIIIIFAVIGTIFAAIYALLFVQRALFGESHSPENSLRQLSLRESGMLLILVVLLLIVGFYPKLFLETSYPVINEIQQLWNFSILDSLVIGK